MKLIAINSVHAHRFLRKPDPKDPKDKGEHVAEIYKPGTEFETRDHSISDDEALRLVAGGAAKRKTREVAVDDDCPLVLDEDDAYDDSGAAKNTAPRGPASGQTIAPNPDKVARDAGQPPKR